MKMYIESFILTYVAIQLSAPFNESIIPPVLVLGIFAEDQQAIDSQIYVGSI